MEGIRCQGKQFYPEQKQEFNCIAFTDQLSSTMASSPLLQQEAVCSEKGAGSNPVNGLLVQVKVFMCFYKELIVLRADASVSQPKPLMGLLIALVEKPQTTRS